MRFYGRIAVDSSYIDVVASENLNEENHKYEKINWEGHELFIETFENRYALELNRNRKYRLIKMEKYKEDHNAGNKD